MNSLVKLRLESWIENSQPISSCTYGFIKRRSTNNCINHLLEVMALFANLEDGFNNVNLMKLQWILNAMNIPKQIINWIISSYEHHQINIDTKDDLLSEWQAVVYHREMYWVLQFLLYIQLLCSKEVAVHICWWVMSVVMGRDTFWGYGPTKNGLQTNVKMMQVVPLIKIQYEMKWTSTDIPHLKIEKEDILKKKTKDDISKYEKWGRRIYDLIQEKGEVELHHK